GLDLPDGFPFVRAGELDDVHPREGKFPALLLPSLRFEEQKGFGIGSLHKDEDRAVDYVGLRARVTINWLRQEAHKDLLLFRMVALDSKIAGYLAHLSQAACWRSRGFLCAGKSEELDSRFGRAPEFPAAAPPGDAGAGQDVKLAVELIFAAE